MRVFYAVKLCQIAMAVVAIVQLVFVRELCHSIQAKMTLPWDMAIIIDEVASILHPTDSVLASNSTEMTGNAYFCFPISLDDIFYDLDVLELTVVPTPYSIKGAKRAVAVVALLLFCIYSSVRLLFVLSDLNYTTKRIFRASERSRHRSLALHALLTTFLVGLAFVSLFCARLRWNDTDPQVLFPTSWTIAIGFVLVLLVSTVLEIVYQESLYLHIGCKSNSGSYCLCQTSFFDAVDSSPGSQHHTLLSTVSSEDEPLQRRDSVARSSFRPGDPNLCQDSSTLSAFSSFRPPSDVDFTEFENFGTYPSICTTGAL